MKLSSTNSSRSVCIRHEERKASIPCSSLSLQVFSIVVFSCIVNEGYINIGSERLLCVFNNNSDACNYGITIGVACFLASICFLILDVYFPSISSVRDRRRAVLLDLIFSGNINIMTNKSVRSTATFKAG